MRKTIAMTVLLLSACTVQIGGGADAPETTAATTTTSTTTTTVAPTTTEPELDTEEMYLLDVILYTDLDDWYDDRTILEFGYTVCDYFSTGGTNEGLAEIIYDAGVANGASEDVMLAFAGAAGVAVSWLCPEHSWKV